MTVYILKNENPEALLPLMSEQRLEKINDITAKGVRTEKICSYALLRYALFKNYGIEEAPVFSYGECEKPYLSDYPHIFFSLSHAGGFSACCVCDAETGLDIQDIRPMKFDISHRICTEKELAEVSESENISEEICRLWCMKESYGKLTGKGFAEGFGAIETSELTGCGRLKTMKAENGMYVSVCGNEPLPEIELVTVTTDEISDILS